MSQMSIGDKFVDKLQSQITNQDKDIESMMTKGTGEKGAFTEMDMVKMNMAVSRRSTVMSLFSGAIKNLTDTEKQVASKM